MALDGLVLHAIVHELQTCVGGRINKIHQPTENDIIDTDPSTRAECKLTAFRKSNLSTGSIHRAILMQTQWMLQCSVCSFANIVKAALLKP